MILWGAFNGQIQVFVPEDTFGDDRPDFLKNSLMRRFFVIIGSTSKLQIMSISILFSLNIKKLRLP